MATPQPIAAPEKLKWPRWMQGLKPDDMVQVTILGSVRDVFTSKPILYPGGETPRQLMMEISYGDRGELLYLGVGPDGVNERGVTVRKLVPEGT